MPLKITLWLVITLFSTLCLGWFGLSEQKSGREEDFRITHRELSQRLAQQQAILFLAPGSTQLEQLRRHFPQLTAIEQKTPDQARAGETVMQSEGESYWLYNPYSGSALQINGRILLQQVDLPVGFNALTLSDQQRPMVTLGDPSKQGFWQWQKSLGENGQSFQLTGSATPVWSALPWLTALLLAIVWAAIIYGWHRWQILTQYHYRAEQRARFADRARLNAMGEIATGIAHELNQPLTATLTYNQTALRLLPAEDNKIAPLLNASVEQIKRIAALLERLRTMLGNGQINLQQVSVSELWLRVEYLLASEISTAGITIHRHFPSDLPRLRADPLWLEQIFHNLLSNAIHALQATPQPEITIEARTVNTRQHEQQLLIQIADNGSGLDPHQLANLFTPFYTTRSSGLGLGLTLCETLIQRLGGEIKASNTERGGACFTLTLPIAMRDNNAHNIGTIDKNSIDKNSTDNL